MEELKLKTLLLKKIIFIGSLNNDGQSRDDNLSREMVNTPYILY